MSGDLISREAALSALKGVIARTGAYGAAIEVVLANVPAVEAEPVVHAHWIDMQENEATEGMWRCSACGSDRYFDIMTPIECGCYRCPHCGAHMDEEVADGN